MRTVESGTANHSEDECGNDEQAKKAAEADADPSEGAC